jgi:uncharacterized membrane protein
MSKVVKRIWELDFLRGIAILMMVAFHTVFDLNRFYGFEQLKYYKGFWFLEGRIAAYLFILLTGITTALIAKKYSKPEALKKNLSRGLRLIALGMLITLASWIMEPSETIWFGILHFLGFSILFSSAFMNLKWMNLVLALASLMLGKWTMSLEPESLMWIPLGATPVGFRSLDYYPLFPWISAVFIGLFLGNWIYQKREAIFHREPRIPEKGIAALGKYSLWIYMLHQPIILMLLWLILG